MTFPMLIAYYEEISEIRKERAYPFVRIASQQLTNDANSNGGKKPLTAEDKEHQTPEHYRYKWHEIALAVYGDLLPNDVIEVMQVEPVSRSRALAHVSKETAEAVLTAYEKEIINPTFYARHISHLFLELAEIAGG